MHRTTEPYRPEAPMVPELAAGAVLVHLVRRDILLLHHREEDRWCFPKGHVDPGESLTTAAIREIREETGLTQIKLESELAEQTYRFYDPRVRHNVHKTTVYFLAFTPERTARPEGTFDRYEWVDLATARDRVAYDTDRRTLETAGRRLAQGPRT